ncbi:MAG: hypothetical protein HY775_06980 [Acidobacteria bacterium]|nr:hypothetical protein [Acidobacteriota bacterium]
MSATLPGTRPFPPSGTHPMSAAIEFAAAISRLCGRNRQCARRVPRYLKVKVTIQGCESARVALQDCAISSSVSLILRARRFCATASPRGAPDKPRRCLSRNAFWASRMTPSRSYRIGG